MNSIQELPGLIEGMGDGISLSAQALQGLQKILENGDDDLKPLARQIGRMKALSVYLQQQANAAAAIAQQIVDQRQLDDRK